jgi:large repetitive protein
MMFGYLFATRPKSQAKLQRSFRPTVEALEARDCPTLHVTLAALVLPAHQVRLSGTVAGGAGLNLYFNGVVTGNVTTDANGNFSYTTAQATLGTVNAQGMNTDQASASIAVTPPSLSSLAIAYGAQRSVTVSGTLNDIDAASQTVHFGGVVSGSAVTDGSGHFSFTANASALGTINVGEMDLWGQASSPASVTVTSAAPVIQNFTAVNEALNIWIFTGNVVDESAAGLTITFGGCAALNGQTTTVQADGSFSFTIQLPAGTDCTVTAITTDWWGLMSNTALTIMG